MKEQSFEVISTEELQEVVGGRRHDHWLRHVIEFGDGLIHGLK